MVRTVVCAVFCVVMLLSSGCGWLSDDKGVFQDRSREYLEAPVLEPINIPGEMSDEVLQQVYVIPQVEGDPTLTSDGVIPRPEKLSGELDENSVRIQKLGGRRWVLVNVGPGQIWYQLHRFMQRMGFTVDKENGSSGVIETGWIPAGGQGEERYRFQVIQGVQRNTAEVHILQVNRDSPGVESPWPQVSDNTSREMQMVRTFAQFLADTDPVRSVSYLAQGISTSNRLVMVKSGSGEPMIKLKLGYDRGWGSLGYALAKSGLEVLDRDRSRSIYLVAVPENDKEGFFGSLFGGSSEETPDGDGEEESGGWGRFLDSLKPSQLQDESGSEEDDSEQEREGLPETYYQVHMLEREKGVLLIRVSDQAGNPLPEARAIQLLNRIKGYLS